MLSKVDRLILGWNLDLYDLSAKPNDLEIPANHNSPIHRGQRRDEVGGSGDIAIKKGSIV